MAELVEECRLWYEAGCVIKEPSSVRKSRQAYAENMDIIKQFMAEACEAKSDGFALKGMAFAAFEVFARRENQWKSLTAKRFHNLMESAGYSLRQRRDKNGKMRPMGYYGFVLNRDYEDAASRFRKNRERQICPT